MIADIQTGQREIARSLPIEALPTSANGRPLCPFQIVSLDDVKRYYLVPLQNLASIITGLYDSPLGGWEHSLGGKTDRAAPISPEHVSKFLAAITTHEKHVKYFGLKQSLRYIETIKGRLNTATYTYGRYERDVEILQEREDDELRDYVFGFIPAENAPYYGNEELFGNQVKIRFPSAESDIKEAGNCYAHGTYTASVFHLMRVLEIALHVLAKALAISFPASIELENWQNIIEKIESEIATREKTLPKGVAKSEELQFYSEAAKEFRYFKNAWRNHVSHSREDYDIHDATKIMEHVRDFMQHVATRLKE